jgi:hypothetical protein
VSRAPEDGTSKPDADASPTPDDADARPDEPIKGEDTDGPAPDDGTDSDRPDTSDSDSSDDSDAPPVVADPNHGRPVDDDGVPLNFLGNRQGEHKFAEMGDYIPMGGDRSNGMGSYDQRVAPLIADHDPWGVHGDRDAFNANHRPDGTYKTNKWPDNDGAVRGSERPVTLPEGAVLDRFGGESGRFLSPMGTDGQPYHYRDRAIFPDNAEVGYHVYVVIDPDGLPGTLADVAPALGQPGGGRQFTLDDGVSVDQLIKDKVIKEVHVVPSDGKVLPDSFGQDRGDGTQNTDTVSVDDARDAADADSTPDADRSGDGTPDGTPPDGTPSDSTPPLPDNLQQIADQSSFRTPAGGALFDTSDTITRNAANAVTPIDGHFVLDVHSDGQHAIVNGQRLNGADLADLARHMGWNGTDPIILNACEAGRSADGLAADLAQSSGAQVIAPTERSWSGERNTTPYSASVDSIGPDGRPHPTIPPDGGWRAFEPDGSFGDTGSNGLPVDTQRPGDTAGSPEDGPSPTQDQSSREPVDLGGDASRGPIQSPFVIPPDIRNANDPTPIAVDNNAAATADPNDPTRPLRTDERLIGRTGLAPDTAYRVDGRGTYYTDGTGRITHADLEVGNERDGIKASGVTNPDATYPEPRTTYRVDVDGATHTYTTDRDGLPPMYNEWQTPRVDNSVTFPSNDPNLPANHPLRQPLAPREALSDRTGFPPYTQITYSTPHGTTTLYTGAPDPNNGGLARVEAIDTYSSPDSGKGRVNVDDLNPELNNFPPNTVTRINGEDVYLTNDHGVTYSATDSRNYNLTAPRSSEAQDMVASLGTGTDGGHIRPTQAGGAPDARNQFPQDSDENRPKKGQSSRETWYGQDMEAGREQKRRGTTMLWHDFQTEGAHSTNPAQPTAVHERWVMQEANGTVRIHFRRYDN